MALFKSALAAGCAVSCFAAVPALADDPSLSQGFINILSPADGAVVTGGGVQLAYTARLTPEGDHFDVSVDGGRPVMEDRMVMNCPCSFTLPKLAAGAHKVTMQEATATGGLMPLAASVQITVK